jgi:hypothetical protein
LPDCCLAFSGELELLVPEVGDDKRLVRNYRLVVPVAVLEWQEESPGLGPDLLARFIGLVGNPRIAIPMHMETFTDGDEGEYANGRPHLRRDPVPDALDADGGPLGYPRTLRQLWAYAGIGDAERRPQRAGIKQDELLACGRRRARAVLYNVSNSLVRTKGSKNGQASPYTLLYETTKMRYEMKVHDRECIRCGTPGKPAQVGTGWKDSHKDASAKRILAKAVVRDLWLRS